MVSTSIRLRDKSIRRTRVTLRDGNGGKAMGLTLYGLRPEQVVRILRKAVEERERPTAEPLSA